jgi:UPF0271 protein
MKVLAVDLNCDLGEGCGYDAEIMPFVTSASIACGGHAGDAATMRAVAELARRHGTAVGAHPGYPEREYFGRRELHLSPDEVERLVAEQVAALQAIAPVVHVKPHGALYNQAARDATVAEAVVAGVRACGAGLALFAPAGSVLAQAGRRAGLRVVEEAFADRRYRADGSLAARNLTGAVIEDEAAALAQALALVRDGTVMTLDGTPLAVRADTLCLHGDGAGAGTLARALRSGLEAAGVTVRRPEG